LPCFITEEVDDPDAEEECFTGDAGGTGGASKK
jgi:hypothetical protein